MPEPMRNLAQSSPFGARARSVRLGASGVVVERRPDGVIILRSPQPLASYPEKLTDRLDEWAARAPDRTLFAARDEAGSWRTVNYGEAHRMARSLGQALLQRNLSPDRPLVILSGNDLEHALLGLAAMYVGIPYAPISPAYSLVSTDFGKLRHIVNLLTPGLIFAADGKGFSKAITAVAPPDVEIVVVRNKLPDRPTTLFSDLTATRATAAVDAANARIAPDAIAKFLFTSGSTGQPKGVINTHRMLCSNQAMILAAFPYFADEPPVIVDWCPWHHTAGGNHDVGLVLYNGGSFYLDEGKPVPGGIAATIRNLREIAPTWYFNVPKGYEALLPELRSDRKLRENFFSRLKVLFYAAAGMPQHLWDEIHELAVATCGERIPFLTSLGATETAPMALVRTFEVDQPGNIGLPGPGLELKLVPADGKFEARLRGPNITPGYWRDAVLTANAFDEEGFYKLGDALKFADPADPAKGLLFDGRIAEDFKLGTGTWVSVGPLRTKFIDHFAPYVKDVVIAGHDRDEVAALIFPDIDACRRLGPDLAKDAPASAVLNHPRVRSEFEFLLRSLAKSGTGSSNTIVRAMLLDELPSLDAGEVTDKGSVNQRAVLKRRAALVEELYATPASARVMIAQAS